jgi:hypothetical protein
MAAVPAMAMPSPVAAMAPTSVPTMMMAPTHFGRGLPRILLHRARSTRIDQRHRARLPDRRCHHQNYGDSDKAQNFSPVHLVPPIRKSRQRRTAGVSNRPAATQMDS